MLLLMEMRFALTNRDRFLQMGRGRGRGGVGRGRFGGARGDGSLRFSARDEPPPRRSSGWGVAPPSRHLWVGSLGPGVTASDLSELFLRCGEVEGIAREPGRSFGFVSFLREEDSVAALHELQGFRLRGAPIRIEFSKGVSVENPPASITVCRAFFELFICFVSKVSLAQYASLIMSATMKFERSITKFQDKLSVNS